MTSVPQITVRYAGANISPAVRAMFLDAAHALQPPPRITVTEWAEQNIVLSPEDSAEGGARYRSARAPYQRGMQDAVLDPLVRQVTFFTAAQIGKTQILKNILAYFVAEDPAPILWMVPTLELAKKVALQRLVPLFRDCEKLSKLLPIGARIAGNTQTEKSFSSGAVLFMVGANSAASLSSMPIRIVLADERARYPESAGQEGDPLALAEKRQTTYWNAKTVDASTCTIKGACPIEASFEDSNQQKYWVPCPHCGEYQVLSWDRLIFSKTEEPTVDNVHYACAGCAAALTEWDKQKMLEGGEWRAEKPEIKTHVGFWISELYSPFVSWHRMAALYLEALRHPENPEKMKTFVNLSLAQTYEEESEQADAGELMARREQYPPPALPDGVTVVTAGVDVQADRIEIEVVGWGKGEESWSIDVARFGGETKSIKGVPEFQSPWEKLDDYLLNARFMHARGIHLPIAAVMVDSGFHAQEVYAWTGPRNGRRIYASKGQPGFGKAPLGKHNRNNRQRVKMYPVSVDVIKEHVYSLLKIKEPGAGYMHFSRDKNDADYFAQLTAEKLVRKYVHGYPQRFWQLKVDGARNEALDMRVYAYAAFLSLSEKPAAMLERLRKDLLEQARHAAAERRSKVDPNQLSLLEQEFPVAQESAGEDAPATAADVPTARDDAAAPASPESTAVNLDAALDPKADLRWRIEQRLNALREKTRAARTAKIEAPASGDGDPDPGFGANEYQVVEKIEQAAPADQQPEPPPARSRIRMKVKW